MTGALLDRPTLHTGDPVLGDGVTLEQLLSSALQEALANGSTECPVCHARMSYTRAGEGRPGEALAAECADCGSRLS